MRECWNFFRYASLDNLQEVLSIINYNKIWFSHISTEHIKNKIENKECILESGILITFKYVNKKSYLGDFLVKEGNTILEQIARKDLSIKTSFAEHIFTKFINCAYGKVYLMVNVKNRRAIKFYKKMKMIKVCDTKLDKDKERGFIFASPDRIVKNL